MDDKVAFMSAIDLIYSFLTLEKSYFGIVLSFGDILFGLFVLFLVVSFLIRILE